MHGFQCIELCCTMLLPEHSVCLKPCHGKFNMHHFVTILPATVWQYSRVLFNMWSIRWKRGFWKLDFHRSSDPRSSKPLSEMSEFDGTDIAAMLPVVGEDEEFHGGAERVPLTVTAMRKRQRLVRALGHPNSWCCNYLNYCTAGIAIIVLLDSPCRVQLEAAVREVTQPWAPWGLGYMVL